ncbi:hypothetical protein F1C16_10860 [Hymenobacter sp. NBH84]|uniref:hypothetical protein n=1 Tax=Hymenobacter sp. NBH84 TaxID=2596915 RepID=UPI001629906F|nr:hypothetical protein [Hymenobacter sp. NBH84]QNE40023.1 hypothetical protein F1C16_10860 [Hymenobacter sp. NBH84]
MKLSVRAQQYIQKQARKKHWLTAPRIVDYYLKIQKVIIAPDVLLFQENYSGYVLTIRGKPRETFNARLFSGGDIAWNRKIELINVAERYVFDCGFHATAQFSFFITDKGEICTWEEDDSLNILYSSFDKFVEEYALRDELSDWYEYSGYYELLDVKMLNDYVDNSYKLIEESSDAYNSWWTNGEIIIRKGVWLDRTDFYIHVYAKMEKRVVEIVKELTSMGIVK